MPDPITAVVGGGSAVASIAGGRAQSRAARQAADAQVRSAEEASRLQREMFAEQVRLQEPFRQGGMTGQNRLMELLGIGGNANASDYGRYGRDFAMSDFEADPGYAFRLAEGNKQLERAAAARGMMLSGSMFKGLQNYGQGLASQEYQNAFNRYQVNRSNQIDPLQQLMGQGQGAANVLAGAAGQLGSQLGENAMGAGNARAAGYIGRGNATANMFSQLGDLGSQFAGMMPTGGGKPGKNLTRPATPYGGFGAGRGGVG